MITVWESGFINSAIQPPAESRRSGGIGEMESLDLRYQQNDYLVVQLKRNTDDLIGRINERGCI